MDVFAKRKAAQAAKLGALAIPPPSEVDRVLRLPRGTVDLPVSLGSYLRPGTEPLQLRPVQEQALAAIAAHRGLIGAIGVGHGKSLIALLAGAVLKVDLSIVLVAPATVPNMEALLRDLEKRYTLPETVIVSWGALSQPWASAWLDGLDTHKRVALIADEAHFARNPSAARTRRLMGWLNANPDVAFVALSGTMTTRRLKDFAHLAHRALGDRSPLPRGEEGRCWDEVLGNEPRSPADVAAVVPLWNWASCTQGKTFRNAVPKLPQETHSLLVQAFGEHLRSAPGVVLTQDASCPASLYIQTIEAGGPAIRNLQKMAAAIAQTYRDPAGIELADDSEVARTAKRLSFGYYYRWAWPDGVADTEWLDRRQAWARKCRWLIQEHARKGFDTRALVEAEAARRLAQGSAEEWVRCYAAWREIADRVEPAQETVWVTDQALLDVLQVTQRYAPCIIWYDEEAIADKLVELGVQVIRAGQLVPTMAQTCALSVRSHGAGLNLQAWHLQVFACCPSNGTAWEQVLGRTHRQGQQEDEVWTWLPQWTGSLRAAFAQARRDAAWIETATGNRQKLLLATVIEEQSMVDCE